MKLEEQDYDLKIWRYMDFTKYVDLLDRSALFFSRADKLGDPFEGSHGQAYFNFMKGAFKEGSDSAYHLRKLGSVFKKFVKFSFLSCWHINEQESAAMWTLYLKSNEGIAVQSTIGLLKSGIKTKKYDMYGGRVKCIDYDTEVMEGGLDEGERYPFYYKRKSYEHEQEFRLLIQDFASAKGPSISESITPRRLGLYVPVDLNKLIEKVYVAPSSTKWLHKLVESITKKYGLDKDVVQSSLNEKPIY